MIVDASAILAILLDEPEQPALKYCLADAPEKHTMSPINYLEAAMRVDSLDTDRKARELDNLIAALDVEIVPTTTQQAHLAREAYQKFGKGNHPARLNLGDCFAYALAKARGEPLLFKGDDFRKTDIEAAL
ncbi:PIN domain-containing protein [Nitratireductor sp. CAU 1489]|uniref:Ribonuclease VapC n=1 Tax=Nitratireductor arenosus TaxID=2682096 RepID=A0A844QG54_9HYPH|nr:type II toxin-antitoxin system VapC family toxin [Nitratireductor arenosus]MVA98265.1 PIN domain-containing protein [Nitratireductor arenosus]